ncbi:MAG: AMP-binding protein, partial [Candidatus Kapaibacterium sp.]
MNDSETTRLNYTQGPALGPVLPNIASMLRRNAGRLPLGKVFSQKYGNEFHGPNWLNFAESIDTIALGLREHGLQQGESVAIVSQNRVEMLELELAVMASGAVAIPIFPFYPPATLDHLLEFCGARFVAVQGAAQLDRISPNPRIEQLFVFDDIEDERFPQLLPFDVLREATAGQTDTGFALDFDADPDSICLRQYTSGTSAKRKLVELSHRNILSQQAALDQVWDLNENDRLLSYLPWHHSFGGIFELFTALYRGVPIWLEPSFGKDPRSILEHWKQIRPTAFFSVPRVYQSLVDLVRGDPEAQEAFLTWRTVPAPKRGEIIRQIGEELRKQKDLLGSLV